MFCPISSGFSMFSYFTREGQIVPTNHKQGPDARTVESAKLGDYLDPLNVVIDFGRQHHMEVFCSFRMNDAQDAHLITDNKLKQDHPDWLRGSAETKPIHGSWTGVNYDIPAIRDLAFRYVREVCQNYDIDGIELDFFRHPNFFLYATPDAPVTQAQRDLMTTLVRRIRTMADEEGKKRGRPILLAVRVPDSVEWAGAVGLDLPQWLNDGLVDLLITGGYIRLNDWKYSVALGHAHGAKVYPSLDESRITAKVGSDSDADPKIKDPAQALRETASAYRARAIEALSDGTDGIYLFNFFQRRAYRPPNEILSQAGTMAGLTALPRTYFASYLGLGRIPAGGYPHQTWQKIEIFSPTTPKPLAPGAAATINLDLPEDPASIPGLTAIARIRVQPLAAASSLRLSLNDQPLSPLVPGQDYADVPCPSSILKKGPNTITLTLDPTAKSKVLWQDFALEITPSEAKK